jgi:hypothetical protein
MTGPHIKVESYTVSTDGADTILAVAVHEGKIFNLHFAAAQFREMVARAAEVEKQPEPNP